MVGPDELVPSFNGVALSYAVDEADPRRAAHGDACVSLHRPLVRKYDFLNK